MELSIPKDVVFVLSLVVSGFGPILYSTKFLLGSSLLYEQESLGIGQALHQSISISDSRGQEEALVVQLGTTTFERDDLIRPCSVDGRLENMPTSYSFPTSVVHLLHSSDAPGTDYILPQTELGSFRASVLSDVKATPVLSLPAETATSNVNNDASDGQHGHHFSNESSQNVVYRFVMKSVVELVQDFLLVVFGIVIGMLYPCSGMILFKIRNFLRRHNMLRDKPLQASFLAKQPIKNDPGGEDISLAGSIIQDGPAAPGEQAIAIQDSEEEKTSADKNDEDVTHTLDSSLYIPPHKRAFDPFTKEPEPYALKKFRSQRYDFLRRFLENFKKEETATSTIMDEPHDEFAADGESAWRQPDTRSFSSGKWYFSRLGMRLNRIVEEDREQAGVLGESELHWVENGNEPDLGELESGSDIPLETHSDRASLREQEPESVAESPSADSSLFDVHHHAPEKKKSESNTPISLQFVPSRVLLLRDDTFGQGAIGVDSEEHSRPLALREIVPTRAKAGEVGESEDF